MGIDYSFQISVHQRDTGRLLTAVAALCDRSEDELTTVVVADGPPVVLPGTYQLKTEPAVPVLGVHPAGVRGSSSASPAARR